MHSERSARPGANPAHNKPMIILYFLADTFINTFGITRPTEKARKQAALFILALLLLLILAMVVVAYIIHDATK